VARLSDVEADRRRGEAAVSGLAPEVTELARACGVATSFTDWSGRRRAVPAATVVAVLVARGMDATTPHSARAALQARWAAERRRLLPPCTVTRSGRPATVRVHVPTGGSLTARLDLEDGGERRLTTLPGETALGVDGGTPFVERVLAVPAGIPLGWHRLTVETASRHGQSWLVVTPDRLELPAAAGSGQVWGFLTQLYATRSRGSWGIGDLADLAALAAWSGRDLGAGLVVVNPLHAASPLAPMEPSPYLPATRRFVNPLYLRIEDVPEMGQLPQPQWQRVVELGERLQRGNTSGDLLDRDATWAAKREALELLHALPRRADRQAAYDAYQAREGSGLVDFATWCALAERHGLPWQRWPVELRDPRAPAVAAASVELADRVDLYCWMQWLLDHQLAAARDAAQRAGMPIGVVHDLAVGVDPAGADAWALGDVLASGVAAGAPPDAFNQQGQGWAQPPWSPDRLAAQAYLPWRDLLRSVLRHAGGLRVDHVIGLFRLWWVPAGEKPSAGTYVRYDHEALVGILALEAYRAGAVLVGEDLGTVEPAARAYLAERGLLGTSILWFERDGTGRPRPPERWRELCLATLTSHDLPPTAGYLAGEHVRLRAELGLLTRPIAAEQAADAAERASWLALLRERGLVGRDPDEQELVTGLHALLAQTPSRLLGVSLADAVGDRRTQNQPGTVDEYPNWRVPLTDGDGRPVLLDELPDHPRVQALARAVTGSASAGATGSATGRATGALRGTRYGVAP